MFFQRNSRMPVPQYTPWNKDKLIGPKPPLQANVQTRYER